jgi:glycosyltransferase involved in cell wall biosynthesis
MISIDVVIANYNNAPYLRQCIESVLAQTLQPEEIIVIDDGSTDESKLILQEYANRNQISLVTNKSARGVATSRNIAIGKGKSSHVTTLDSDDYYYSPRKLEKEAEILLRNGPNSIAFSDVIRVDLDGRDIDLVSNKRKIAEGRLYFNIRHLRGFIPRDYLVERRVLEAVGGYNPDLTIYEDWDLKIRLADKCDWYCSGEIGTAYRQNPAGLSRAPKRQHIRALREIFFANCPSENKILRSIEFMRFFVYQSVYLRRPAI